jgi:hypothetical protein
MSDIIKILPSLPECNFKINPQETKCFNYFIQQTITHLAAVPVNEALFFLG